ncbi:MAG: hypothetical protein ACRCZ0_11060 [Cetobacterium sp.]
MKKYMFLIGFLLSLVGCTNSQNYNVSDFFVSGDFNYNGGFENAGSKTSSKIVKMNGMKYVVENTSDTATNVERVYLISKDSIDLVFVGEDTHADLNSLDLSKKETVLKAPLQVGNSWESNENIYEISDFIDAESGIHITVQKLYPNGTLEKVIYQKDFGKIFRSVLTK